MPGKKLPIKSTVKTGSRKTKLEPVSNTPAIGKKKATDPVSNRATLSAKNPIPFEGGKAWSFINNQKYLPFLALEDNYGSLLLESRLLSVTHNACIKTKKDYCAGSGFQHEDGEDLDANMIKWFESMNRKDEPISEILGQMFESIFTFGNTPIELVRFEVMGVRYFYIYVHNFLEWRLGEPDEDDIVQEAIQSKLFLRSEVFFTESDYNKSKKLPIYNPRKTEAQNWKQVEDTERTLIWYKHSVSGYPHYGLPSAVSALIYEINEYKGARYNLDNLENNMVVSAILALRGNLSQAEADRIGKKAVSTHTGDGKRGRVMVVASEEGIEGSDMHSFDTHKDGSYIEADNSWMQKIILANEWDAVLAGILSPSTLGKGSGFLTKILEIKQNTVIRPAQQDLIKKVFNNIFKEVSKWMRFKIDIPKMQIKNSIDISALTDVDITPAVKVNEVRISKGLPKDPSPKGEMYLGELKQKQSPYVKNPGNPDPKV